MVAPHPPRDLIRRMKLLKTTLYLLDDFRTLHLRHQRPAPPALFCQVLGYKRTVGKSLTIPRQLPADRRAVTAEHLRDPLLRLQSRVHFRYLFTLLHGKMLSHRWDSVRMACLTATIRASQRAFSQDQPPSPLSHRACVSE